MKKSIITCALMALASISATAVTPLWTRYAQISPDGQNIVFTYKGDIYRVAASGGKALQLTTQSSYEMNPVWSPDGKYIAFASDRKGNFDVFVMPADGGAPQQLTFNSSSETPWTFSPDGKYIYFSASIQDPASSILFPSSRLTELYKVPVGGGVTTQVIGTPAEEVCMDPKGKFFLYQDQKGMEDALRKHHTSSVTRDLWRYDFATGKHTNLTAHAGEDRSPVLSPDGKNMYFLSERNGGSFNVYKMPIGGSELKAVTSFKGNPVRFLSVAQNGTLCYTYDGEIYTQTDGGKPRKVAIDLFHDDSDQVTRLSATKGAASGAVSPDGKQVAFVVRGEVFVTSVEYATTKCITNTPEAEDDPTWVDNRTLIYASERGGNWQLVKATIDRKEDLNFPNATTITEEILLPSTTVERALPKASPDGKKVAFIEDRTKLKVLDLKTKKVTTVTDGSTWYETNGGFNYNWSPDGKWFTLEMIGNQRDPYSDVGIVSAEGGKVTNITSSGYFSENPKWVLEGNAILFMSNRYGMRSHASWGSQDDVLLCFVNQEAYDKYRLSKEDYELLKEVEKEQKKEADKKKADEDKKKDDKKKDDKKADEKKDEKKNVNVELDGIEDRVVRLTPNSSSIANAMLTNDGENLYYLSKFEGGFDLWKLDMRKHSTKLVNKMNSGSASMQLSKDGKELFILGSAMNKVTIASDKLTPITYSGSFKMDLAAEREYMFEHVHKQVAKRFYNLNFHGVNWDALTETYRKFLPHINNNYDYANLLSELLGELNVSHTGGRYYPASGEATACLGLLFDLHYTGKGLKVDEVLAKGPFGKASSKVKPGVIVEKINGTAIEGENDYSILLAGLTGKKTLVSLYDPKGGNRWDEVVLPISKATQNNLLYTRWVKHNEHVVDSISGGRLGYVHIKSMNDESYREVYSQVLGKFNKKEGIVIDVRFNGGGRLHEDIEVLFSGKKYFTQVVRGREACDMPSRRWNKPSIMVTAEACYSNAHGTPWVYQHQGLGKIVGMPVPGTMTSVSWETLQDNSLIFGIPIIGYRLPDGSYLENTQLEPDVKVANDPADAVKGYDAQLKAAVMELLKECK